MLVLARKLGEKIFLTIPDGTAIVIEVVDIDRGKIRLGLSAPRTVDVRREELLDHEDRERLEVAANK